MTGRVQTREPRRRNESTDIEGRLGLDRCRRLLASAVTVIATNVVLTAQTKGSAPTAPIRLNRRIH